MSKKVNRVRFYLRPSNKPLQESEIIIILRAADSLIRSGGRTLLIKILKGSKEKKIFELNLNRNPSYGYFKPLSNEEISSKVDWLIANKYLAIEYDYRLPLLVFTLKGWEIAKDILTSEIISLFDESLNYNSNFNISNLKDKNREMITLLFQKIEALKSKKYIPILEAWEKIEYKKVRQMIRQTIKNLSD